MMDREAILAIYAQGPEAVVALVETLIARYTGELAALRSRVQALEDRLATDSHNSHQPPSRDQPPQPRSLRTPSGRTPGGQPGHPGTTLAWSRTPDAVVEQRPATCAACGADLSGATLVGQARRQVVDLPVLRLQTTEQVVARLACPACGARTAATFPPEASAPVSYGPRVRGLALYLSTYQLLPSARTQELLNDLFGCSFSAGTLARVVAASHATLAATETAIQQALHQTPVVHFDETGLRVAGQQQWLHVACTDQLTHYGVQRQRGAGGMQAVGILPGFGGVAVHDGLPAYGAFGCQHARCNVHHLRELTFVAERHQQAWAADLAALLHQMQAAVAAARAAGQDQLAPALVRQFARRYRALALAGVTANPPADKPAGQPGPAKRTAGGKLAERLGHHEAEVLRFLTDFRVPFDNNQAERDIRMVKVHQKIAGCFRTVTGAAQFARLRGYVSTARKQGHAPLLALQAVCGGKPLALT
jgi:transposase